MKLGNITLLKKYNKLKLELDVTEEKLERKIVELNTERRLHKKQRDIWEAKLKEQEEEIIKLKRKRVKKNA